MLTTWQPNIGQVDVGRSLTDDKEIVFDCRRLDFTDCSELSSLPMANLILHDRRSNSSNLMGCFFSFFFKLNNLKTIVVDVFTTITSCLNFPAVPLRLKVDNMGFVFFLSFFVACKDTWYLCLLGLHSLPGLIAASRGRIHASARPASRPSFRPHSRRGDYTNCSTNLNNKLFLFVMRNTNNKF